MYLHGDEVDFISLAEQDSDFASVIQAKNGHVDFQDPTIVKQLTISLLKKDFGLKLELPDDRLCPPVPVRYSYVRWIQNLLASCGTSNTLVDSISLSSASTSSSSKCIVSGLDIGTGASCIYPLLYIASVTSNQEFEHNNDSIDKEKSNESADRRNMQCAAEINIIATDTDPYSLNWARHNIALNSTMISSSGSNIHAVLTKPSDPLLLPVAHSTRSQNEVLGMEQSTGTEAETEVEVEPLDFTMCNPPFYSSVEELEQSYADKDQCPAAVCTGSLSEMVYHDTTLIRTYALTGRTASTDRPNAQEDSHITDSHVATVVGGDAAFALRILTESSEPALRHRVRWYSCMLGKLSSLKIVIERIKALGVSNWAVCQLRPGNRTKRWAIAWSWGAARPSNSIAREGLSNTLLLPVSNECTIRIDLNSNNVHSSESVSAIVAGKLKGLEMIHWSWKSNSDHCHDSRDATLSNNTGFDRPTNSNNSDRNDERKLSIRGMGVTQGNVWSRSARRRLHFSPKRRHGQFSSGDKGQGQDEVENLKQGHSQPDSDTDGNSGTRTDKQSEPQKQHICQPSLSFPTPDPRVGTQSRKRRREDHDVVSDEREAATDANTRTTTNDDDNNNSNNNSTPYDVSKKNETKSFNKANLFAFSISIHTEDASSSPSSTSSTTPSSPTTSEIKKPAKDNNDDDNNNNNNNKSKETSVTTIRWLYGHDRIVFESFCGMIRRTLQSACNG